MMTQQIIIALLPWAIVVVVAVIIARILVGLCGAKLNLGRLKSINRCETGSVQSLSFVLTLPFFVMIIMLIVQVSQIMIANIVVHYAAYASVRAAVVWIPTNTNFDETQNRISSISLIEVTEEGSHYQIFPSGDKFQEINQAAVLAVMPLGPSRDLGYTMDGYGQQSANALINLYAGLDSDSLSNSLIPTRLWNKLAYSYQNTFVEVDFWHRVGPHFDYQDPPLQYEYLIRPYPDEYYDNELGWQDHITATVSYNIPLLPGPVRLFAPAARRGDVSRTDVNGQTYAFLISASATMMNEGEKPLLFYWQEEYQ